MNILNIIINFNLDLFFYLSVHLLSRVTKTMLAACTTVIGTKLENQSFYIIKSVFFGRKSKVMRCPFLFFLPKRDRWDGIYILTYIL